jgi:hypothetical protein
MKRDAESDTKVHRRGREVIQAVALQIVLTIERPAPEMVEVEEEEGCEWAPNSHAFCL